MFALADRLHMTVADLMARMTVPEFVEWQAYLKVRADYEREAYERARQG